MKDFKIYTLLAALILLMGGWKTQAQTVKGNGNIVTHDFEVAAFNEIKTIFPAMINYTVADDYSCRVTLDENLFEYLNIHTDGDELVLGYVPEKVQHTNLTHTEFIIELSAPMIEEISIAGSTDFCFVTPFETQKLKIQTAGSGNVVFKETVNIHDFDMQIAGSGTIETRCQLESMDYSIAGSGRIRYLGNVKVQGKNIGGRISRIDSENANGKTKK